jgi:hypothetical protein
MANNRQSADNKYGRRFMVLKIREPDFARLPANKQRRK